MSGWSINLRRPRDWRELVARRPKPGHRVHVCYGLWGVGNPPELGVIHNVRWAPSGGLRYKALHVDVLLKSGRVINKPLAHFIQITGLTITQEDGSHGPGWVLVL